MDKTIKLTMTNAREIVITVNDEDKHIIKPEERVISADSIYRILDFADGDNYTVSLGNESGIDSQVLDFFAELFTDIVNKVNTLSSNAATDI
ncbi:hypothetical protein DWUX_979 [Desulfovibrio diazotrophicus]|nr:hypothetical protein DWUX_979 [Desulfovibrio diazotrophicus]VVU43215.1 hypothetical protein DWUX_561 [Desulfovibrio diazotrophicus]